MPEVWVYSTDRTWNNRLRRSDEVPASAVTKWHRSRPDDRALAACSRHIVLNVEDRSRPTDPVVGDLCLRCFPRQGDVDGRQALTPESPDTV